MWLGFVKVSETLARDRALNSHCTQRADEHLWVELHQVAAPPAVDKDAGQRQDAALHVQRHGFFDAKGGGAAYLVGGVALGDIGLAGLYFFGVDAPSEVFGADGAISVHEDDEGLACVVLHDQGFNHGVLLRAQLLGGFCRAAVLDVVVGVGSVGDA